MERKLNDQWIEEFDGKMHMVKAVHNEKKNCNGCVHGRDYNKDSCLAEPKYPCGYMDLIIKDLGILNEDGCLPCPFCGEYPSINIDYNDQNQKCFEAVCINHGCQCLCETLYFSTLQETIDTWNRRA